MDLFVVYDGDENCTKCSTILNYFYVMFFYQLNRYSQNCLSMIKVIKLECLAQIIIPCSTSKMHAGASMNVPRESNFGHVAR